MGVDAIIQMQESSDKPSFAPPFLRAGRRVIGQTANILQYLGPRIGLVSDTETNRLWTHQLQLTVEDFIVEIHDTHHPISGALYYHDQKAEAKRRAKYFTSQRAFQFLHYFELIIASNKSGKGYMVGHSVSYIDLSMFQLIEGLRYAFPNMIKRLESKIPHLIALHARISQRPNIAAYLSSPRRISFNEDGIFRHYPELE
jgi:glutathione S-transferase